MGWRHVSTTSMTIIVTSKKQSSEVSLPNSLSMSQGASKKLK